MRESAHLRPRDGGEQRATAFELFFDLVFVFAITQVAHHLIKHLSLQGLAQATFMLLMVWWAWNYTTWMTNWFDPDSKPVRLVLIVVMGFSLLMSVALPDAFGDRALLFAGSYVALQVIRNAFNVVAVDAGTVRHRSFIRILAHSVATGVLWITGAVLGGEWLVPVWICALALDYMGPYLRYWTPGMGATPTSDWTVHGGHFAERFQLFIIIALGESIVVTGATAADSDLSTAGIVGIMVAFLITAAMWWLYFNYVAERALTRISNASDPGRMARDAFTYLHLPIVMGIILAAVADELLVAHPNDPFEYPIIAVAGPVMYLFGHSLFRLRMAGSISYNRVAAMIVMLLLLPFGDTLSALTMSMLVLLVLVALIVREQFVVPPPIVVLGESN